MAKTKVIDTYVIRTGRYAGCTVKVLEPVRPKYIDRLYGRDKLSDDIYGRIYRGETLKVARFGS